MLLSTSGLSVSAIQVDLLSNNSILSIAATAGQSASNASKTLYGATVANSQQRFVLYGLNQIGITDGSIINLVLTPAQTSLAGPYELTLLNVVAISPDGSSASASISPGATPPVIPPAGLAVVNGASLALGAVAPGEIVTLFGSGWGLSGASGIAVTFNGVSAPVVYAGANQINAVVPFEMAGQTGAAAGVTYFGRQIGASIVGLTGVAPAAFTIGDGGAGQAAVVNQDTTLNSASQPAARGLHCQRLRHRRGRDESTAPGRRGGSRGCGVCARRPHRDKFLRRRRRFGDVRGTGAGAGRWSLANQFRRPSRHYTRARGCLLPKCRRRSESAGDNGCELGRRTSGSLAADCWLVGEESFHSKKRLLQVAPRQPR